MEYIQVAIPRSLLHRFEKIRRFYGYRNFSELVNEAARQRINVLETKHEIIEDKDYVEEAKELRDEREAATLSRELKRRGET